MGGNSAAPDRAQLLARSGDQRAFADLVGPYLRELHVHCYRMLGSFQDAEDVMQEVLLRAWRHLDRFENRSSVRQWLYRIATNRCLTFQARAAARPAGAGPVPPPPNAPRRRGRGVAALPRLPPEPAARA